MSEFWGTQQKPGRTQFTLVQYFIGNINRLPDVQEDDSLQP